MSRQEKIQRHLRRLDLIFEALSAGKQTAEEIEAMLAARGTGKEGELKGEQAEQRVSQLIMTLPWVVSVERTGRKSIDDLRGIDAWVKIEPVSTRMKLIEELAIQVKSSEKGVREFKKKIRAQHRLRPEKVEGWLRENCLIIINAEKPDTNILNGFTDAFREIIYYFDRT